MSPDSLLKTGVIGSLIAVLCHAGARRALGHNRAGVAGELYGLRGTASSCPLSWPHRLCTLAQDQKSVRSTVHREGDDHETSAR